MPKHVHTRIFAPKRLLSDRSGASAVVFAIALPGLLGLIGGAVDYASITQQKSQIRNLTDSAALAVARQMTMQRLSDAQIEAAARNFADANAGAYGLQGLALRATPTADRMGVRVESTAKIKTPLGLADKVAGLNAVGAGATARVGQETKLCLLSVSDTKANETKGGMFVSREPVGIDIGRDARLTAPGCLLHTNISTKTAFNIGAGAKVTASVLCAAGGVQNAGGVIDSAVLDSCPRVPNPMEHRFYPHVGQNCAKDDYKETVFSGGTHEMRPGNYCGNIRISGNAKVRMSPGVYAIQGRLLVSGNAELVGQGVGIYLWGGTASSSRHSYFSFTENSLIDLSAPETGQMAGVLIWEGINGAAKDQESGAKGVNYHQINTMRARRLTGTIYLPGGRLLIDAPGKVAEESDYTVLLVNRLDLADGPNLVLNSNYAKSRVPVPQGLGPVGARNVRLEK